MSNNTRGVTATVPTTEMPATALPTVVIGAGPIGLAAAHLVERGIEPLVLEAGDSAGAAVRQWSHVRTGEAAPGTGDPDRWGTAHYGRLSALLTAPATVAAALAPWAGAALAGTLGGYAALFAVLGRPLTPPHCPARPGADPRTGPPRR